MNINGTGGAFTAPSSSSSHRDAAPTVTPAQADAQQPIDVWRSRMTGPGFREIEGSGVPDEQVEMVAALCLELACGHHPDAVKRVLSINANVRTQAMLLLKSQPPRDAPYTLRNGLARAIAKTLRPSGVASARSCKLPQR